MLSVTRLDLTHVTAPARVGGAESVIAALARGLAGRGHRCRLISLLGPSPDEGCLAFQRLEEAGVEVHEIRLPPRSYAAEWRRVAKVIGASPTIAHCHGYHADLVGWRAARLVGRPLVSTVHGFTGGSIRNRAYEWLDRRLLATFDAVVAVSAPLRGRLGRSGIPEARVHLLPNAFSPASEFLPRERAREELGLPADPPVVGWVGRLTAEKGPDLLVDALTHLPSGVIASVVGSGAMAASLQHRAVAAGLDGRIRWHGMVPAAARILRAFDVLVISSRTEGTPMVLLEAMAAGVPVVTTAVGGIPDVVSEAEAVLVPEVTPGPIAAAIARCLDQPSEARARVEQARARVGTSYGIEPWLDRHEQLYRSLR